MKIQVQYREGSACDYHRCFLPFRMLPLEDGESAGFFTKLDTYKKSDFKDIDLVIFNRISTVDIGTLEQMKKEYGFKVWCDVDDYWELYPGHYMAHNWKMTESAKRMIKCMQLADVVTTTNIRLLKKIIEYNPKCKIIPNAVPIGHEQFVPERTESTRLRLAYMGGPSHYHDLKTIDTYFDKVKSNMYLNMHTNFIMCGYDDKTPELINMSHLMSKAPGYSTRKGLPLHKYMQHYNHADIIIAPLELNTFNTYKSNLKIIEAGAMGLPIIASKMYPYLEDESMNNIGLRLCDSIDEWVETTRMFVSYPAMVTEYGARLYDYVKEKYDLLKVNKLRRDLINYFKIEKYGNGNKEIEIGNSPSSEEANIGRQSI